MESKIAITFTNMIQYYAVKPGLDTCINKGYEVHIYIPDFVPENMNEDNGYIDIYNETYELLKKEKYIIKRKYDGNDFYKIVLTPYYMTNFYKFKYKYNIKYMYGVSAKPNVTLGLIDNIDYDAIMTFTSWEVDIFSNFCPTYNVGNTKFYGFEREKKSKKDKPILLYLPTYGNVGNLLNAKSLKKLGKKYKLVIKLHHNTLFLESEADKLKNLNEVFDEVLSQDVALIDLLKKVDFVLTDNSGSIFEAMLAGIPVAMFSDKFDLSVGELKPLQETLVDEGILLCTNDPEKLEEIVEKSTSKEILNKQKKKCKEIFPYENDELVDKFVDVIDKYMNDDVSIEYYQFHNYLRENVKKTIENESQFYKELVRVCDEVKYLNSELIKYKRREEKLNKKFIVKVYRKLKSIRKKLKEVIS